MKEELRPFTEETLSDADSITQRMFGLSCLPILKRILSNPLRKSGGDSAGEVAYQDGELMGFQAAIVRQLYWNGMPITGIVGSTLGMRPDASPVLLMHLMKATIAPRMGSRVFFANTSCPESMKMNKLLGVKGVGPSTCSMIRYAVTYWPKLLKGLLPAPKATRIERIDYAELDAFWTTYLKTSKGLVCSRTGAELDWMFGDQLKTNKVVMLGAYSNKILQGYVVFSYTRGGKWAVVYDLIALRDDKSILFYLVKSATKYLRKYSRAVVLDCVGFNKTAQSVLSKALPFKRKAANNSFIFQPTDKDPSEKIVPDPENDWFWGPYDGDLCMG